MNYLIRPTFQEIYDRIMADMESRMTGNVSILRRALLRVLAAVFAGAIHLLYGVLSLLARDIMPDQAQGEWLGRHGYMWGVPQKNAEYAEGTITINGTAGSVIPAGTVFIRGTSGIEYETIAECTIAVGGQVLAEVKAVEAGSAGNYLHTVPAIPGEVLLLSFLSPVNGVDTDAIISTPGLGSGADLELVEDWRTRILARIQSTPMGGSKTDYVRWAKEVSGVDDAWCYPTFAGSGTVAVVIRPYDLQLATDVQTYIDDLKPVTANDQISQYVFGSEDIAVSLTIAIQPFDLATQNLIDNALAAFFEEEGAPGGTIIWSHIDSAIASTGVRDYKITSIVHAGGVNPPVGENFTIPGWGFPVTGGNYYSEKV